MSTASPAILNTTVTIESPSSSYSPQIGTPLLFKSPPSPGRKVLKDVNKNRKRSNTYAKLSTEHIPAKKASVMTKNLNKTTDPLYRKTTKSLSSSSSAASRGGIANQGIANRKRKLLSVSHSNSFFKPLTESWMLASLMCVIEGNTSTGCTNGFGEWGSEQNSAWKNHAMFQLLYLIHSTQEFSNTMQKNMIKLLNECLWFIHNCWYTFLSFSLQDLKCYLAYIDFIQGCYRYKQIENRIFCSSEGNCSLISEFLLNWFAFLQYEHLIYLFVLKFLHPNYSEVCRMYIIYVLISFFLNFVCLYLARLVCWNQAFSSY